MKFCQIRVEVIFCALLFVAPLLATEGREALLDTSSVPDNFGVQLHVERYNEPELDQTITYLKIAGINWIRADLVWSTVEKKRGDFDFSFYDSVIRKLRAAKIKMLLEVDFWNPLYDDNKSPVSLEGRAAFARFAAAAAQRYSANDVVWEIYNEPNLDVFWRPKSDVAQYLAMAADVTKAIRVAAPDAAIVGPALSGPYPAARSDSAPYQFLKQVLASDVAREWDAITVHPYRSNGTNPESVTAELEHIRNLMPAYQVPLLASEWGYSTWLRGASESTQAAYAVRTLLWGIVEKMPFSIWYDWQDDGPTPLDREYRFGLVRSGSLSGKSRADIAKPAFDALETATRLLRGYHLDQLLPAGEAVVVSRFSNGTDYRYVVWSKDDEPHMVSLNLDGADWNSEELLREARVIDTSEGKPVTVYSKKMPTVLFRKPS